MQLAYVPHGINNTIYFPITDSHSEYSNFVEFSKNFKTSLDVDFIIFWNNRNIRRKQPGDVVLAYRMFCDKLPKEKAAKCLLYMHTDPIDENGTDLIAVVDAISPNYKIQFSTEQISSQQLNYYYNLADVTLNIASNEGFGLSSAEALSAGCVVINNVTGGLQDQMRFRNQDGSWLEFNNAFTSNHNGKFREHGEWAYPVFPTNRSMQGSVMTPYIFDERCSPEDVADGMLYWYNIPREERKKMGMVGSQWMQSKESGMSSFEMCRRMEIAITNCLDTFIPKKRFELLCVQDNKPISEETLGIDWK